MNPREKIISVLCDGTKGYYHWIPVDVTEENLWLLRVPRWRSEDIEPWMQDERVDFVHICSPSNFCTAMNANEKEHLAESSGYVREGRCAHCEESVPENLSKKLNTNYIFGS